MFCYLFFFCWGYSQRKKVINFIWIPYMWNYISTLHVPWWSTPRPTVLRQAEHTHTVYYSSHDQQTVLFWTILLRSLLVAIAVPELSHSLDLSYNLDLLPLIPLKYRRCMYQYTVHTIKPHQWMYPGIVPTCYSTAIHLISDTITETELFIHVLNEHIKCLG